MNYLTGGRAITKEAAEMWPKNARQFVDSVSVRCLEFEDLSDENRFENWFFIDLIHHRNVS